MLTKGAIGNLVNRYKAVLRNCNLINTFGSLAVASMLVLGGAAVAGAAEYSFKYENQNKDWDSIPTYTIKTEFDTALFSKNIVHIERNQKKTANIGAAAIYTVADMTIKNSLIEHNTVIDTNSYYADSENFAASSNARGVVWLNSNKELTIDNSDFKYNKILFNNPNDNVKIKDYASGVGGAITVIGGTLNIINNCEFESNEAGQGGAIYLGSGASATISNATFKVINLPVEAAPFM